MIHDVDILMPVAWPSPHLRVALTSIARQSGCHWRLILVADGDSDLTLDVARSVIPADQLVVVRHESRQGIVASLNDGLARCSASRVARMDSDDVMLSGRLAMQCDYMDAHPEVVACGTGAFLINERGVRVGNLIAGRGRDVRRELVFRNQLVHSAVMMDREAVGLVGGYREEARLREDFDLWLRLGLVGELHNVDSVLLEYRLSDGQLSKSQVSVEAVRAIRDSRRNLGRHLGMNGVLVAAARLVWEITQRSASGVGWRGRLVGWLRRA